MRDGTILTPKSSLHGKTSKLRHDSEGIYEGIPQGIPVTRYHSLAGTHSTFPTLASWIECSSYGCSGKGIIMGVRHKVSRKWSHDFLFEVIGNAGTGLGTSYLSDIRNADSKIL